MTEYVSSEAARIVACYLPIPACPDSVCLPITITAGDLRLIYAALAASPQGEGSSADPAPIKPSADTGELRERVAQIVDPAGFDDRWDVPGLRHEASLDERVDEALAKADAILDLIQSERAG